MTATVIEAPPVEVTVEQVERQRATEIRELEIQQSWAKKMAVKAKKAQKKSKKAFRRAMKWLRDRAVKTYRWITRQLTKAQRKLANMTAKIRAKQPVRTSANWVARTGKSAWLWGRGNAIAAWNWAAPARAWVTGPVRFALGTTAGLATILLWGTPTVVLITSLWIAYLMTSNRLVMRKQIRRIKIKAPKGSKAKKVQKVEPIQPVSEKLHTDAQDEILEDRVQTLLGELYGAQRAGDKTKFSELTGQLCVARQRLVNSEATFTHLAAARRKELEVQLGVKAANEMYNWAAVKRGAEAESEALARVMEQTDGLTKA